MTSKVIAATFQRHLFSDFLASIVVFLVALPLCMGISIASGVPPEVGILSGVIGGLVVATLGGCELQITGPAAGLAVVVTELIAKHGIERLAIIVLLAGVIQVTAGAFKLAQWFRAVPPSVIHGMLSGIGLLIFASQFHVMIDDSPKGSGINNLLSLPSAVGKALTPNASLSHEEAAAVGLITLITLIVWEKGLKSSRWAKAIPGSLVAVVIAAFVTWAFALPIKLVNLPDNILSAIHIPTFQTIASSLHTDVLGAAMMMAFIASAETLLTAAALDKMHHGPRSNFDKELIAQGIGNTLSGIIGALPLTGVMVRSGVNVAAGAHTRLSGILHGIWLLAAVIAIPHVVSRIPTSALAALLVFAGWKLANFKMLKELKKYGRGEVVVWVLTVTMMVCTDLLTGVLSGIALAAARLLWTFSHLDIKITSDDERTDIVLRGVATFLVIPRLADALEDAAPNKILYLHLDGLDFIDHACLDLLQSVANQRRRKGGETVVDWDVLGKVYSLSGLRRTYTAR